MTSASLRSRVLAGSLLALLSIASASQAAQITTTAAAGWPNGRTSNDTPPNAIDGSITTATWTTESFNVVNPSYLGVAFDASPVQRIRLWKSNEGGGGENIKNLIIQYTTDPETTPLASRTTWITVTNLTNGHLGAELMDATSVDSDGTVTGDVHNSNGGDGWASLTFSTVNATGVRIGFSNPSGASVVHYRVFEFEVHTPEPATMGLLLSTAPLLLSRRRTVR